MKFKNFQFTFTIWRRKSTRAFMNPARINNYKLYCRFNYANINIRREVVVMLKCNSVLQNTHTHTHTRKCANTMKLRSLSKKIRKIWGKFWCWMNEKSNPLLNVITSEMKSAFCEKLLAKPFIHNLSFLPKTAVTTRVFDENCDHGKILSFSSSKNLFCSYWVESLIRPNYSKLTCL